MKMFYCLCVLGGLLAVSGCATTSSVATRKEERLAAYVALTPEQKLAVDSGQIKIGMSMDAVYIAWGRPSQVLQGESSQGSTLVWLYHGTYFEEYRYWNYHSYYSRGRYFASPQLTYDYQPRGYVRAEVKFENGVVKEWRSLPQPAY